MIKIFIELISGHKKPSLRWVFYGLRLAVSECS
jgi:hypothetical protein